MYNPNFKPVEFEGFGKQDKHLTQLNEIAHIKQGLNSTPLLASGR